MRRIAVSMLLLALVFLMGETVFAGEGDTPGSLKLVISPTYGVAGDVINISGSGAVSGSPIIVSLTANPAASEGALAQVEATPGSDGSFSATLTVPADVADGKYAIRAAQRTATGGLMHYHWNAFTVGMPTAETLLPDTGAVPGTPFTITAMLAVLLLGGMVLKGFQGVLSPR